MKIDAIVAQLGTIFADAAASAKTRRLAVAEVAGMIASDEETAAALAAALIRTGKDGVTIARALYRAGEKLALAQTVFVRTVWTVGTDGQAASLTKDQAEQAAADRKANSASAQQAAALAAAYDRIAKLEALASSAGIADKVDVAA